MPQNDLVKFVFHHDQRMDSLAAASKQESNPLAMFTQPDPTYSTLFFSGSNLNTSQFGLNTLQNASQITTVLDEALANYQWVSKKGKADSFRKGLNSISVNEAIVGTEGKEVVEPEIIHSFSGKILRDLLEKNWIVVYKREAPHGYDVQLFSKENLYTAFFYLFQKELKKGLRVFSINGKRISNEQQFYFETHRLEKPPHGFEEILPESVL